MLQTGRSTSKRLNPKLLHQFRPKITLGRDFSRRRLFKAARAKTDKPSVGFCLQVHLLRRLPQLALGWRRRPLSGCCASLKREGVACLSPLYPLAVLAALWTMPAIAAHAEPFGPAATQVARARLASCLLRTVDELHTAGLRLTPLALFNLSQ